MKKLEILIFIVIIINFIIFVKADIIINEVMPHSNNSLGDEWVEIYNNDSSNISLILWKIADSSSNDNISINISGKGYGLIVDGTVINCSSLNISKESCVELTTIGSGLNDGGDNITLYNSSGSVVSNFSWNYDIKYLGFSWQFYNNSWYNCTPTAGRENYCNLTSSVIVPITCTASYSCSSWSSCSSGNQTRSCINASSSCINTTQTERQSCETEADISLELENFDNIIEGEEREITIKAYNLLNYYYDIKLYIHYPESDSAISQTYNGTEWISSRYYIEKALEGEGDIVAKMRIKLNNNTKIGDAEIAVKIRRYDTTDIITDASESITTSKKQNKEETVEFRNTTTSKIGINNTMNTNSSLNLNGAKDNSKEIIYESKNEIIKKYALIFFTIFLLFIIIFLLIKL